MHPDDLRLLAAVPAGAAASESIADALGTACATLRTLSSETRDDLDEGTKGIGWWSGHGLDVQARILIADQLSMAAKFDGFLPRSLPTVVLRSLRIPRWAAG